MWLVNFNGSELWDDENEFETKDEAIKHAKANKDKITSKTGRASVGRAVLIEPEVDAESILDLIQETTMNKNYIYEDEFIDLSEETIKNFNKECISVIKSWLKETGNVPATRRIVEMEEVHE